MQNSTRPERLTDLELSEISLKTENQILKSLINFGQLNQVGQKIEAHLTKIDGRTFIKASLTTEPAAEGLIVGQVYKSINSIKPVILKTARQRPYLGSLNVGSFGLNGMQHEIGEEYYENGKKLIKYIRKQANKFLVLHLQDFPNEPQLLESLANLGFDVYFLENIFYSEGVWKHQPNCGLAILVNKSLLGFQTEFLELAFSLHNNGFQKCSISQPATQDKDRIEQSLSFYLVLQNKSKDEVYCLGNTYITAFSTQLDRLLNINESTEILNQLQNEIMEKVPGKRILTRFTGDFNLYGYDTLKGPIKAPSEPFAHYPAAISGLITGFKPWSFLKYHKWFNMGINYPNLWELAKLRQALKSSGFVIQTGVEGQLEFTKIIQVSDFVPGWLEKFTQGLTVGWYLDLVLTPAYEGKLYITYDNEPYGDFDHKTLIVEL